MLLKSKNGYRWGNDGKVFTNKDDAIKLGKLVEDTKHNKVVNTLILDGVVTLNVGMKDKSITLDAIINEETGFLTVDAVISRTGVQQYLSSELGEAGSGIVGVYRPVEEVTHPKSMKSFTNVPITDNHPNEMVTIDNISKYGKGSISNVNVVQLEDETGLATKITITDKDLIKSVLDGKKELSVGYTNILVAKDGNYKGEDYKYIQTNIIANHVAVVDAGRCGGICKMQVDSLNLIERENMIINIDGVEYDVPEAVANKFNELMSNKDSEEGVEKEAMDKLKATVDSLKVENANLKATKTNDADLNKAVTERVELLRLVDTLDGVTVKPTDDSLNIKRVIVDSIKGMSSVGKSEAYLDAVIDREKALLVDKETRKQAAYDSHVNVGIESKVNDSKKTIDIDAIENQEIGGK